MNRRPTVPPDVAHELRQESYFGCCSCGHPILQYHHIVPWRAEQHFRVKDMMALCPNCHDQVTKGAMSEAKQRTLKADPFNRRRGWARGMLCAENRYPAVALGTNVLMNNGPLLMLGDEVALGANVSPEGSVLLDLAFRDRPGNLLMQIRQNEWIAGDANLWDLEFSYNYLRLRAKKAKVVLELDARQTPIGIRAVFWYRKNSLSVRSGRMVIALDGTPISFQDALLPGAYVQFVPEGVKIDPDRRLKKPLTFFHHAGKDSLERAMTWLDEAT